MDTPAIEAHAIGKRFGNRWALRGVSCTIARGEVVGLFGANGSGKSTFLRILATLMKPSAGSAKVDGADITTQPDDVRRRVGFLAHHPGLYDDLTARENLTFAADMLGRPHDDIDSTLAHVGLSAAAHDRVRGFSAGMQRRLALARLRVQQPHVLLLDEPYSNLDTAGIETVNHTIADIVNDGGAAIIALHEVAPAQRMLTRSVTLENGRFS